MNIFISLWPLCTEHTKTEKDKSSKGGRHQVCGIKRHSKTRYTNTKKIYLRLETWHFSLHILEISSCNDNTDLNIDIFDNDICKVSKRFTSQEHIQSATFLSRPLR